MSEPSVSVIIPTYNSAKYIAKSIDSILTQTRQPAEILIIDDGSTDDTRDVVSTFSDRRIRYVQVAHGGTSAARNKGIELVSGDYLAFLDADDLWRPTMLEKQVSVMERHKNLVCCFTNFVRFVDGTGEILPEQFNFYPELTTLPVTDSGFDNTFVVEGDAFVQIVKFGEIPAYMQCIMFRRAMIADMRLNPSLTRCQDLEFVSRVLMRGRVAFTREVLTDVRRHHSNATRDISLMALDKLWALQPLQNAVDTPARRVALNDRLVRAQIDAATALIRVGRRSDGFEHYTAALIVPGSGLRKIRGTARIGYELAASLCGREPVVQPNA
jgi:glycosyltransferase involved in cell wall biosynthesis